MILTIVVSLASIGFGYAGRYVHQRFRNKKIEISNEQEIKDWRYRSVLSDSAWEEFKRHIEHDGVGWYYADASINALTKHGHRFSCAQVYQLRDLYVKKWPEMRNKKTAFDIVDELTKYHETAIVEAEEKTFGLITGADPKLLTDGTVL